MNKAKKKESVHTGSTFDSFLEEEGIRMEVHGTAMKRVLAWQFAQAMEEQKKTKVRVVKTGK